MEYSFLTLLEHFDYDVLDFLNDGDNVNETPYESSDEYYLSDEVEELDYVDFHTEGEENVVIKNQTTQDHFLNKLCSNHGSFRQSVFGTHASARGCGRGFRGSRGGPDGRNGSERGARGGRDRSTNRGPHLMDDDEIRVNLEHDYMQDLLDVEMDKREHEEREHQERLDEEAFQEAMEQQSMYEQIDEERERQNREERE
ncbi:hypothetical protein Tco_0205634 [Tanacetum coccineum]